MIMNTMRKCESDKCFNTLLKYAFLLSKNDHSWERAVNYNPMTNLMVKESGIYFYPDRICSNIGSNICFESIIWK